MPEMFGRLSRERQDDDCGGCECEVNGCVYGPAYNSPEGKERRQTGLNLFRQLSVFQIALSSFSIVVGLASIGVAAANPQYPQINGYAVGNGILILIGAVFGRMATVQDCVDQVSSRVRAYIMVHYVMNITCLTFSTLQVVFTGVALSECFSVSKQDKCMPHLTAEQVLDCMVIVAGIGLFVMCLVGTISFFMYARVMGYTNRHENMRQEIDSLRQQVQAQQGYKGTYNTAYDYGTKTPL